MTTTIARRTTLLPVAPLVAVLLLTAARAGAQADVPGLTGTSFDLTASAAHIDTPDGDSLLVWGYGVTGNANGMQYPGPTLIVNQGATVTITLRNALAAPVSMVFPGQGRIAATPISGSTRAGNLALEADPGAVVRYQFTASQPGTYLYHSGTRPDVQVEMGLLGAIVVRPAGYHPVTNRRAYAHAGTTYDHEYLLLLTEFDPVIHNLVDFDGMEFVDAGDRRAVSWLINGRNASDTMLADGVPWMPHQPYGALVRMHPGEKVLMRIVGGGRDLHPFHHHGNHATLIARDGRVLESAPGAGAPGYPDLATADFTQQVLPGATMDAIFEWTGKGLGFDVYGHAAGDALEPHEYAPDHGKPLPITLPELQDLTFGGHWSGSPFLGRFGELPPGEGGLNMNGGYFFMWHSHTERELVNNDIFPGGMMTMLIVEPPDVPIP